MVLQITAVKNALVVQVGQPSQCVSQYPLPIGIGKTLFLCQFQKIIGQVGVQEEQVARDRVHHGP
jgi:hypothetical protein